MHSVLLKIATEHSECTNCPTRLRKKGATQLDLQHRKYFPSLVPRAGHVPATLQIPDTQLRSNTIPHCKKSWRKTPPDWPDVTDSLVRGTENFFNMKIKLIRRVPTSNGKSSIVEDRLYSFFFVFFQKKRSFVFSFFLFYTIRNEDVCFASIL